MTEEEAKKKWCPEVRFVIGPDNSVWQGIGYTNRAQELNRPGTCCLGSDCMMWVDDGGFTGHCGLIRSGDQSRAE
jgi:hypothetical protein